jgi:hypothetical protein
MNWYMIVLRAIHLLSGVFWAGSTFLLAGYSELVLGAKSDKEQLSKMVRYARMSQMVGLGGFLSLISGALMYWQVSGHLNLGWITGGQGLALTVGGLAGLGAVLAGMFLVGLTNNGVVDLNQRVEESGGEITSTFAAELRVLRQRLEVGERTGGLLLVIAVLGMAVAQYVWV